MIERRAAEVGAPLPAARPRLERRTRRACWSRPGGASTCRAPGCPGRTRSAMPGSPRRRHCNSMSRATTGRCLRPAGGARWPARLQRLVGGPAVVRRASPPDTRSGWTAATIRQLARAGRQVCRTWCGPARWHLVVGMLSTKSRGLAPLLPRAAGVVRAGLAGEALAAIPRPRPSPPGLFGGRPRRRVRRGRGAGDRRGRSGALRRPDLRLALPRRRGPARPSLNPPPPCVVRVGWLYPRLSPPGRWVWRVGFVVSDAGPARRCSFSSLVVVRGCAGGGVAVVCGIFWWVSRGLSGWLAARCWWALVLTFCASWCRDEAESLILAQNERWRRA